jgi:hypothetical protein
MSDAVGRKTWVVPAGFIRLASTGPEPAMTSRDELRLLNTGRHDADVEITIVYADREPIGPYSVTVAARRMRRVRVNDLIDPLPVPLEVEYSIAITASHPIVVQCSRMDTSADANAVMGTIAFGG